eukprot:UN01528
MIFRNANKLLYNSRIIGVGGKSQLFGNSCLNRSSPILSTNINRSHSLFWQRMGIDFARARIRLNPFSKLEGGGKWFLWVAFEWWFVGVFVWACIPWFFQIQYVGHWVRSWDFHNLSLQDDTWRDPLIPPPDVWTNQNRNYIEQVKIRKERFERQEKRLNG